MPVALRHLVEVPVGVSHVTRDCASRHPTIKFMKHDTIAIAEACAFSQHANQLDH